MLIFGEGCIGQLAAFDSWCTMAQHQRLGKMCLWTVAGAKTNWEKNKGCVLYKLVLHFWTPAPSGGIEVSGEWAADCLFFSCNAIHHAISNADNRFQAKCYGMRRRGKTGMPLRIQLWETWDKPNDCFFHFSLWLHIFFPFFYVRIFIFKRPLLLGV